MPNAQCPVPNLQSPISNPQSPIPNLQSPIPNPQSSTPNLQFPIPNPRSQHRTLINQSITAPGCHSAIPVWHIAVSRCHAMPCHAYIHHTLAQPHNHGVQRMYVHPTYMSKRTPLTHLHHHPPPTGTTDSLTYPPSNKFPLCIPPCLGLSKYPA